MRYGPVGREVAVRGQHVPAEERDDDGDAEVVAEPAIFRPRRSNGRAAAVLDLLCSVVEVGRAGLGALGLLPLPFRLGHG